MSDCLLMETILALGRAFLAQGKVEVALRVFTDVQLAAERLKLDAMRLDALSNRLEALLSYGRSAEVLTLVPADTESAALYEKRVGALLRLGRFPEARAALVALRFPATFKVLGPWLQGRVRYDQLLLEHAAEWLGPDGAPGLLGAALTTPGLTIEAKAMLQHASYWMHQVEFAQREHRWRDALRLLDEHQAEVHDGERLEADLRRAWTEVLLAKRPMVRPLSQRAAPPGCRRQDEVPLSSKADSRSSSAPPLQPDIGTRAIGFHGRVTTAGCHRP